MNQDQEHLRLLAIFHYVCAGLLALFSCLPIVHIIMGLAMLLHPQGAGSSGPFPPRLFGAVFAVAGAGFMCFGWVIVGLLAWAGRCLSRRTHYTFCLVVAGIACLFTPFGTILGVFTIITLSRPSVKALFQPSGQPPAYT